MRRNKCTKKYAKNYCKIQHDFLFAVFFNSVRAEQDERPISDLNFILSVSQRCRITFWLKLVGSVKIRQEKQVKMRNENGQTTRAKSNHSMDKNILKIDGHFFYQFYKNNNQILR